MTTIHRKRRRGTASRRFPERECPHPSCRSRRLHYFVKTAFLKRPRLVVVCEANRHEYGRAMTREQIRAWRKARR